MKLRSLALAAMTALLALPAVAAQQHGYQYYQCMTDDGYGRTRPCDSLFRAQQAPHDYRYYQCMTDDGYGRFRPCDSGYGKKRR